MGRITTIFLLALCSGMHATFGAADTTLPVKEKAFIEGTYSDFYVDNLNNVYLINTNNQVKKIDNKGDSIAVSNSLKKYGDVYSMDVSNPLKILVHHKDFGTLLILDRFLSRLNVIDLRKIGILQASAAALSYDNNYWVFDEVENKLKKIDDNGNILLSTPDFRVVFTERFSPSKIIDYNNLVYLYDQQFGWLVFDLYGAFKQKIQMPGLKFVQVSKDLPYGFRDFQVDYYNTKTLTDSAFNFPFTNTCIKFQIESNLLYALRRDGLQIYSIQ